MKSCLYNQGCPETGEGKKKKKKKKASANHLLLNRLGKITVLCQINNFSLIVCSTTPTSKQKEITLQVFPFIAHPQDMTGGKKASEYL